MKLLEISRGEYETEVCILGFNTDKRICGEIIEAWVLLLYFPTKLGRSEGYKFSARGMLVSWVRRLFKK